MEILSVTPTHVEPGHLLVLDGTSFGPHPGPHRVAIRNQAALPGRGFGAVVDWTDSRVVVQVPPDCSPGNYEISIRAASHFIHIAESNAVPLTVDPATPAPPASPAGADAPGQPRIWLAHPALVQPGQLVDLYGDFPFPEATDRVVLSPRGGMSATTPPQELAPLPGELLRSHVRVRLSSSGLAPGEYLFTYARNAQLKSNPYRIVIRSVAPDIWESESQDLHGDPADVRLSHVVKDIGWDIHILGLNLESSTKRRQLLILTPSEFDDVADSVSSPGGALPAGPATSDWDETRIVLRVEGMAGHLRINVWEDVILDEPSFRKRSNTLWVTLP